MPWEQKGLGLQDPYQILFILKIDLCQKATQNSHYPGVAGKDLSCSAVPQRMLLGATEETSWCHADFPQVHAVPFSATFTVLTPADLRTTLPSEMLTAWTEAKQAR